MKYKVRGQGNRTDFVFKYNEQQPPRGEVELLKYGCRCSTGWYYLPRAVDICGTCYHANEDFTQKQTAPFFLLKTKRYCKSSSSYSTAHSSSSLGDGTAAWRKLTQRNDFVVTTSQATGYVVASNSSLSHSSLAF